MPASAAIVARDKRILAGYRAGCSLLDLALSEGLDPAVVRLVLRHAGVEPGKLRQAAPPSPLPDCLNDPDWLRAEYA